MPIAFPTARRGSLFDDYPLRYRSPFAVITYPHLGRPGFPLTANTLHPGGSWPFVATNVRLLGRMYADVQSTAVINPVTVPERATDNRIVTRVLSVAQWRLTGISRDNTGAVLGNCQVLVFRTNDKGLEIETVSDGSGNWSVLVSQSRTHFFVAYKAGAPDVFGTSLNDRVPIQV